MRCGVLGAAPVSACRNKRSLSFLYALLDFTLQEPLQRRSLLVLVCCGFLALE